MSVNCKPISQGAPENNEVVFGEEETQRGKPRSDFLNRNKRYRACDDDGEPVMSSKKSIGVMNIILAVIGVALLVFTAVMIWLYRTTGAIPDTLCTCVFAALGGECGVMGWIKTTKERRQEHKWEVEERRETNAIGFTVPEDKAD